MKNIAILIGNSEYQNLTKLDFCKKDIDLMRKILTLSEKFKIHIFENRQSEQLKSELSEIIRGLEKAEINELLFYYTGHGFFKEQFYYLPINFNENSFEQTSLSNNELDSMLKSVNAKMVIKIVDACQSGQQYIKDNAQESIKKTLEGHSFKKCYFFFSSMNNQSSMGNDKGSYFTNAIIESILTHKSDSIRYKDIESYIADYFNGKNESQTPFFIHQANATEIFLDKLTFIQKSLEDDNLTINNKEEFNQQTENNKIDIAEQLKKLSEEYITKDEAQENIKYIFDKDKVKEIFVDMKSIYNIEIEEYNDYRIRNIKNLYNEIEKNKANFFIHLGYKQEPYTTTEWVLKKKKPRNVIEAAFGGYGNIFKNNEEYEEKEVQKYRNVLDSIDLRDDILPIGISIIFTPKEEFKNINKYMINIINFHNNYEIIFYSNFIKYYKNNWDTWEIMNIQDWIKNKMSFCDKDKILEKIQMIIENYNQKINDDISHILEQNNLKNRE